MKSKHWLVIAILIILGVAEGLGSTFLTTTPTFASPHYKLTLQGTLGIIHDDPAPDSGLAYRYDIYLTDSQGLQTRLNLDLTTATRLEGKTVEVTGHEAEGGAAGSDDGVPTVVVDTIRVIEGDTTAAAVAPGSYAWINIMCSFNDIANPAYSQSYFNGLFSSSYPGINHYWNQISGGTVTINGTATTSTWVTLPNPRAYYFDPGTTSVGSTGRQNIFNQCIAAADPQVNFPSFSGINLMLNANMSSTSSAYAYGGCCFPATADGQTRSYRITWLPPWGWQNQSVVAHEMGHGFGMPHSSGPYGASYDSQWDVMSDTWGNCGRPGADDPTYGCLAQGTNSFHLDYYLGWMPAASKITVSPGQTQTVTLERLNQPSAAGYRMVQVPFSGSTNHFYVVEARRSTTTPQPSQYYDAILPGNAVIMHDVLNNGTRSQPAQVVDIDNNSNPNDAAAQWTPGETFVDNTNSITMRVLTQTNTGFTVQVSNVYGDELALFNPSTRNATLLSTLLDNPAAASYTTFATGGPATGQWLMGDWNGDGLKTPGLYANGAFYFTNSNTTTSTWSSVWIGLIGRPAVAGHFSNTANDCIGAVDSANFPPYGTAFALYFTCNFLSGPTPALSLQWLSVVLPDAQGYSGTHQFAAGDWDGNGVDSIAIRRGAYIAFTNVPPTTLESAFNLAQYWGTPSNNDYGVFLAGDWNNDGLDSFGVYYNNGYFYRRNDAAWNSGQYLLQRITSPIGTSLNAVTWRAGGTASGGAGGNPSAGPAQITTPVSTTIESDNPLVKQTGIWQWTTSNESSGGSYLVTNSPDQNLEYAFNGTSVEVIYAQLGQPASFTILIDDVAVRTVILPDSATSYRLSSLINYLKVGDHRLRIVSLSGPVAIDAFNITSSATSGESQTNP
ncbi:MAG: hypothetical protein HY862_10140 [Chloroflexi bacterium]|nr:hypothetical protein [Chloroflexota bacterium]